MPELPSNGNLILGFNSVPKASAVYVNGHTKYNLLTTCTDYLRMDQRQRKNVLPQGLPPRGLSRIEAAAYTGVSPALFDRAVKDHVMPPPVRIFGRVLWDREAIDAAFARLSDDAAPEQPDNDPWARVA